MVATSLLPLASMARPPEDLLRPSGSAGVGWLFGCVLLVLMLGSVIFVWRTSTTRAPGTTGALGRVRAGLGRRVWRRRARDLAWLHAEIERAISDSELRFQARRRLQWRHGNPG